MLHFLFTFLLLTVFWVAVIGTIIRVMFELIGYINLVYNPNRVWHIVAFIGLIVVIAFSIRQYFDKLLELIKYID